MLTTLITLRTATVFQQSVWQYAYNSLTVWLSGKYAWVDTSSWLLSTPGLAVWQCDTVIFSWADMVFSHLSKILFVYQIQYYYPYTIGQKRYWKTYCAWTRVVASWQRIAVLACSRRYQYNTSIKVELVTSANTRRCIYVVSYALWSRPLNN